MKKCFSLIFIFIICLSGCVSIHILGNNKKVDSISNSYEFIKDSVKFSEPKQVGEIIYIEHTSNVDKILNYFFPIFMLFLGAFLDRKILFYVEKKRIKKAGKRWLIEVKELDSSLSKQVYYCDKFITNYCDEDEAFTLKPLMKFETLKCQIFDSLKKEDLYDYLEMKNQSESISLFHKIINIVNTTKDSYGQFLKSFEQFISHSSSLTNNFNIHLKNYMQDLYINEKKYRMLLGEDFTILCKLTDLEINQKLPNINIFIFQSVFLSKAILILSKYDKSKCNELLSSLMECQDCIAGLKNEKKYCKDNMMQSIELFNVVSKSIKELPSYNDQKFYM